MSQHEPYLSVVVAARNDDHGGNLLRRMQTFVNSFIGQCKRHSLNAELVLVEWNPPPERPPLARAIQWPSDLGPCQVRIITVPQQVHRRYKHAEALPLYQMIAKNAGIRRARGRFILATNIDIIFSDELIRFLAEERLEIGKMYRLDRHDVMSDVPVDASVDEQLAYCRSHLIRANMREGTFDLTPDGLRALAKQDVADQDSGINFGPGWFAPYQFGDSPLHRWASNDAELVVRPPMEGRRVLTFEMEPGPSVGYKPFVLQVMDRAGSVVAETTVEGRMTVPLNLPFNGEQREVFRFHVVGGGLLLRNDPHILNFRVLRCAWAEPEEASSEGDHAQRSELPQRDPQVSTKWTSLWTKPLARRAETEQDIVAEGSGLVLGAGWHSSELAGRKAFRWVEDAAELIVFTPEGPPRSVVAKVQPGPAVGFRRSILRVRDHAGQLVASAVVDKLKQVEISLPWFPGRIQVFSIALESDGPRLPTPGDPRTLTFRVFRLEWSAKEPAPWDFRNHDNQDVAGPEVGVRWGIAWSLPERDSNGELFRWARNDAEILLRAPEATAAVLRLELEPGPGVGFGPFELQVRDGRGQVVATGLVRGRQVVHLPLALWAGRSHVFSLWAEPSEPFLASDPRTPVFRLLQCGWAPEPADVLSPGQGLALGAGWSELHVEGGAHFRRAQEGAQLLVRSAPLSGQAIGLDVEPEPAIGADALNLEVRNTAGETLASVLVCTRQLIQFALPQQPDWTNTLTLHLGRRGAAVPQLRVFRLEWTGRDRRRLCVLNFHSPATPTPRHDILPPKSNIALGKGWYLAERRQNETFRWALSDAEIIIRGQGERLGTLCLEIEPGPSVGWKPFLLHVLDASGEAVYTATIDGRKALQIALHVPITGSWVYRLHAEGGDLPLVDDPRILSFRVFQLSWTPASAQPPRGDSPPAEAHETEVVCPEDLHLNACGDFTLLAREHWFDLRGYPEFDLYSFNLDSVLCYAAHYSGARQEMLEDPMRIYHIEHGAGSGWTPEGQAKLFERLRAKGISHIEWPEMCIWATQMRRLKAPMIFNKENWGLADAELRETVLSKESRSDTTP